MSPNRHKTEESLVEQLCTIADVSRLIATNLLEACNNNLELAINMHMEGGIKESNGASNSHPMEDAENNVRAPIPQRQEILVIGEPDQYHSRRNRMPRSVFDRFRDFQAEAKRQERQLSEENNTPSTSRTKMKTLEDLFRPPLDLMFRGSFISARDTGMSSKKWILVNVQNSSEFACQVLNRDVWSNSAVKSIIEEHFIFWQIYHDSDEGLRYMNFYPVHEFPYIAIVDPRTGECISSWKKLDALSFCDIITEFLSSHASLDDSFTNLPTPPKKKPKTNQSIVEADEEAQMEAAIKASLEASNETENAAEESDELETFDPEEEPQDLNYSLQSKPSGSGECSLQDDLSEKPSSPWKQYLGNETDPSSKLILRLPDGSRDTIDMPSTSSLMALVLYVASKGFSNESYEMVTNFPKRRLSYLDFESSLKTVGLYPQETIFVQKR